MCTDQCHRGHRHDQHGLAGVLSRRIQGDGSGDSVSAVLADADELCQSRAGGGGVLNGERGKGCISVLALVGWFFCWVEGW
jgi:hypothetical protein